MRSFLFAIAVLTGCATLHTRAESAFEHEDYLVAADLFDQMVQADPGNQDAIAHRDASRDGALVKLKRDYAATANPEVAAVELRDLLAYRDRWGRAIDVRAEVGQTGMYLTGQIATRTAGAGPLAGEALEHTYAALLAHADFRDRRDALGTIITDAATTRCDALATDTPYLTWLADRYCAHFGIVRADAQPLPDLRGDLILDGDIAGATAAQRASLATSVSSALHDSVWYAPGAPVIAATLDGGIAQSFESHQVTLTKDWVETVSYQEDETSQESYQEPYEDTEQEMVTTYDTVACGDTTCQQPTTSWVSKSVTKYRTAWRTVTNTVTKYRDEPRVFTYAATQVTAHDVDHLHVHSALVNAAVDEDFQQIGYDHDVTFGPGGIAPTRANLMKQPALMARAQDQLRGKLKASLDAKWVAMFCSPSDSAEAAAQCVYGNRANAPAAAHAAIATVFGRDEPFLTSVL